MSVAWMTGSVRATQDIEVTSNFCCPFLAEQLFHGFMSLIVFADFATEIIIVIVVGSVVQVTQTL